MNSVSLNRLNSKNETIVKIGELSFVNSLFTTLIDEHIWMLINIFKADSHILPIVTVLFCLFVLI